MKRILLMSSCIFSLLLLSSVFGAESKNTNRIEKAEVKVEKVFTLAELATFDGEEGRSAYVAINGKVYDVTGVPAWASGSHKGGKVGTDISANIKMAPHGLGVLTKRTKVGVLAPVTDKKKPNPSGQKKAK